jgi:hypothetical protein
VVNGSYEKVTKKSIMKKWILFLLLLFALVGAGCADRAIQEEEPEKEWELGDSIGFCYPDFYEMHSIPLTEGIDIPEWVAVKIREYETWTGTSLSGEVLHPRTYRLMVYRIEWKNHIFYFMYHFYSSSRMTNIYDENGERVKWKGTGTLYDKDSFCADSKNWILIHDFGEWEP